MRARTKQGRYTGHNTPGDGTGLDSVPTRQWDEQMTKDAGTVPEATVGPLRYESRSTPLPGTPGMRKGGRS